MHVLLRVFACIPLRCLYRGDLLRGGGAEMHAVLDRILADMALPEPASICLKGILGLCRQDWEAVAQLASALGFPIHTSLIEKIVGVVKQLRKVMHTAVLLSASLSLVLHGDWEMSFLGPVET